MLAVIPDVRLGSEDVRDLFLGARRDGLVGLELRDAGLVRSGNVVLRCVLVVEAHCGPFGR